MASLSDKDLEAAVDAVIGEALGGGYDGMLAVAYTIANRSNASGKDIKSVVSAPNQYAGYTNPGRSVKASLNVPEIRSLAEKAVKDAVNGRVPDPTGGAQHMLKDGTTAGWASGMTPYASIGGNTFYTTPENAAQAAIRNATTAPIPADRINRSTTSLSSSPFTNSKGESYVKDYDFTPQAFTRTMSLQPSLQETIASAVRAADPTVGVRVTSGGQTASRDPSLKGAPGGWTGSTRHNNGGAADFKLTRDNEVLPMKGNELLYQNVARNLAATNTPGIGIDTRSGYIHAGGGPQAAWGYNGSKNGAAYLDPAFEKAIGTGRSAFSSGISLGALNAGPVPATNNDRTVDAIAKMANDYVSGTSLASSPKTDSIGAGIGIEDFAGLGAPKTDSIGAGASLRDLGEMISPASTVRTSNSLAGNAAMPRGVTPSIGKNMDTIGMGAGKFSGMQSLMGISAPKVSSPVVSAAVAPIPANRPINKSIPTSNTVRGVSPIVKNASNPLINIASSIFGVNSKSRGNTPMNGLLKGLAMGGGITNNMPSYGTGNTMVAPGESYDVFGNDMAFQPTANQTQGHWSDGY